MRSRCCRAAPTSSSCSTRPTSARAAAASAPTTVTGADAMRLPFLRIACALAFAGLPSVALAQDAGEGAEEQSGSRQGGRHAEVVPYIEAAQVLTKELEPGNDTVTYTSVAAGIDASVTGRNSAASISLRYERRF